MNTRFTAQVLVLERKLPKMKVLQNFYRPLKKELFIRDEEYTRGAYFLQPYKLPQYPLADHANFKGET